MVNSYGVYVQDNSVTDDDSREEKEDTQLEKLSVNMATESNFVEGFDLHL